MASINPCAKGYRAFVYVKGVRDSQTFRTMREANAWASARETELRASDKLPVSDKHTLRDLLEKYRDEVSVTKRGARWEVVRINKFLNSTLPIDKPLSKCTTEVIGQWRDKQTLSAGSIIRELGMLRSIFEFARRELKWVAENPLKDVRKPPAPRHREVTISRWQIKKMLKALGLTRGKIRNKSQSVAVCFLLALRTGMRAGELCNLTWVNVKSNYCILPMTKTVPRNVPLSKKAIRLIERMRGYHGTLVFNLTDTVRDVLFRKARDKAGLDGFTFHDARHTAATWISRKVDALTLCKIFGWSDTKMALTYYNPKASDISKLLD